jgi:pimeloyl-ACP methyl ester carboxylesterase
MATFVLLPGAGSDSWYWHLVVPDLEAAGHDVVAVDLPVTDDEAGFPEYADVVVDAIGERKDVVLVAQSLSGFVAPLVAARVPVDLMVLVAAMVPRPGESAGEWWTNTGHARARGLDASDDPVELFLHDVPDDVARARPRLLVVLAAIVAADLIGIELLGRVLPLAGLLLALALPVVVLRRETGQ